MLISLAVVGGAAAVVRGFASGSAAQPATAGVKTTYEGAVRPAPRLAMAADDPTPHASGPVEGGVPHAPPARPADPISFLPARAVRRRTSPRSDPPTTVPPVTAGRRVRSALGVVLLVLSVGLALAVTVAVLVVAVSRALHGAVD